MRGIREGWTKHPWEWLLLLAALGLLIALIAAPRAQGEFHLIKIREIAGEQGTSNQSYIELQMYEAGQNQVAGHEVTFWDADAQVLGMPVPVAELPPGRPQPREC